MPSSRISRGLVALAASAIAAVYVAGYVHTQAADANLGSSTVMVPDAAGSPEVPTPSPAPTLGPQVTPTVVSRVDARLTPTVITDQAVEEFADAHHVSWDEARTQMESVVAANHEIPAALPAGTTIPRLVQVVPAPTGTLTVPTSTVWTEAAVARSTAPPPRSTATPTALVRAALSPPTRTAAPAAVGGLTDGTYSGTGTSRRGDVQVSLLVQGGRIASVNITRATTQYPTRLIAGLPGEVVVRQSAQVDTVGGATFSSLAFRAAVQQALQRAQG